MDLKKFFVWNEVSQKQDSIEGFCEKIQVGKSAQVTNEFMIIARLESLILNMGMEDAVNRAKAYIDAGADGIMIHSRKKDPREVFEFCDYFKKFDRKVPLIAVPSSYNTVKKLNWQNEVLILLYMLIIY